MLGVSNALSSTHQRIPFSCAKIASATNNIHIKNVQKAVESAFCTLNFCSIRYFVFGL